MDAPFAFILVNPPLGRALTRPYRYWDWAARGSGTGIPPIVSQSTVTVTRPRSDGTSERATIPNPLAAYRFLRPQTFVSLQEKSRQIGGEG